MVKYASPTTSPPDAEEFRVLCEDIEADLKAAKTAERFDEIIMGFVLAVHEWIPDRVMAARAIAGFVRGVLEGAKVALPWIQNN